MTSANAFFDRFDARAHALFAKHGAATTGVYSAQGVAAFERRVYFDAGQQTQGTSGRVASPRNVVGFLLADGPVVVDAKIVIAGKPYLVVSLSPDLESDDSMQWWIVRNG